MGWAKKRVGDEGGAERRFRLDGLSLGRLGQSLVVEFAGPNGVAARRRIAHATGLPMAPGKQQPPETDTDSAAAPGASHLLALNCPKPNRAGGGCSAFLAGANTLNVTPI